MMPQRTTLKSVKFSNPFWLNGVDSTLPTGPYLIETDEESTPPKAQSAQREPCIRSRRA
jgi:hypothetical protein